MKNTKNQALTEKEIEELLADHEDWDNGTLGCDEEFVAVSPRSYTQKGELCKGGKDE